MHRSLAFAALLGGILVLGCTDTQTPKSGQKPEATTTAVVNKGGHKHDKWWCEEHGIPEEECLACKYEGKEDQLKAKGDWCEIHDYPKSQCFGCDPKLRERYAVRYRDKYGKEPPEPDDNPPQKNPKN